MMRKVEVEQLKQEPVKNRIKPGRNPLNPVALPQ